MVEVAHAFYDPGLQRWVSRDPLGDAESQAVVGADFAPWLAHENDNTAELTGEEIMEAFTLVNRNLHAFGLNSPVNHIDAFGLECDAGLGPGSLNPENLTALDTRTVAEIAQAKLKRATLDVLQKSKAFGNGLKGSRNIDINKLKQALNRDQLQKAKELAQNGVRIAKEELKKAATDKRRQDLFNQIETQLNRARACKQALAP